MPGPRKAIYVIGAGGHAKVAICAARLAGFHVEAVLDDSPAKIGQSILGMPVKGPIASMSDMPTLPALIAIGNNRIRERLSRQWPWEWATVVHPAAFVDETAKLAPGAVVLAGAVVQVGALVGPHAIVNDNATVEHDCRMGAAAHVACGAVLAGNAKLEDGAMVGAGATVAPGVSIGRYAILGAGAVAVRNVPDGIVAVGVPAKPLLRSNPVAA